MTKQTAVPKLPSERSSHDSTYESRILCTLRNVDSFFESNKIPYAVFGGSGVACYLGHLPRKIHDIDLLISETDVPRAKRFLRSSGYVLQNTFKSRKASFLKYSLKNHLYEMVVSIFPGKFTLLDLEDPALTPFEEFDFRPAIRASSRREINSLSSASQQAVSVRVLPIEDLLISKFWPVVEPTTIHDSYFLLTKVILTGKVRFDWDYFASRVGSNAAIANICLQTFDRLVQLYSRTVWFEPSRDNDRFEDLILRIASVLRSSGSHPTTTRRRSKRLLEII